MLDALSRTAIVGFSALCLGGAFALAPVRARGSVDEMPRLPLSGAAAGDAARAESLTRDPFSEPAGLTAATASNGSLPVLPPAGVAPLPPNLPADLVPAEPGSAAADYRITAIVTGSHPYAMVERSGIHTIEGLGDRIGGVAIDAIDLDGIRLHDGEHLTAQPAGSP